MNLRKKSLMATTPVDLNEYHDGDIDNEAIRVAMIAELDAVSLYEQLAERVTSKTIKEVLLDIAEEEKVHVGELHKLLLEGDRTYEEKFKEGEQEVEDKTK